MAKNIGFLLCIPPYQTSTSIGSEFPCTYLPVFIKFCLIVALGNWYSKYFHWYCRYKFFCASIATKVVINNRKIGILFDIIITTIFFSDLKTPFRLLKKFVELVRLSNLFELRCLIHIFLVLFFYLYLEMLVYTLPFRTVLIIRNRLFVQVVHIFNFV